MIKNLDKKLLLGITGRTVKELKQKIIELEKRKIRKAALFLEFLDKKQKKEIYDLLEISSINNIPLVHARHDMSKDEFKYLEKTFKVKCFNIHERSFKNLKKWKGIYKKLYLELDFNNKVSKKVKVEKIGGFCIDLSHFKSAQERWTKDFEYVIHHRNAKYFVGNHLNGYNPKKRIDIHTVKSVKQLQYLKTLPKFIFGKYIALEMFNSITEQIKYKKYIIKLLS